MTEADGVAERQKIIDVFLFWAITEVQYVRKLMPASAPEQRRAFWHAALRFSSSLTEASGLLRISALHLKSEELSQFVAPGDMDAVTPLPDPTLALPALEAIESQVKLLRQKSPVERTST